MLALIIISTMRILWMENSEVNVFLIVNRLEFKEKMKKAAARVITFGLRYSCLKKKGVDASILNRQMSKFREAVRDSKQLRTKMRYMYDSNEFTNTLEIKLASLESEYKEIELKVQEINNLLE